MNTKKRASTITLDLDATSSNQIDQIVAAVPLANRHAIARAALRVGLTWMAEDADRVVDALRGQKVHHVAASTESER